MNGVGLDVVKLPSLSIARRALIDMVAKYFKAHFLFRFDANINDSTNRATVGLFKRRDFRLRQPPFVQSTFFSLLDRRNQHNGLNTLNLLEFFVGAKAMRGAMRPNPLVDIPRFGRYGWL